MASPTPRVDHAVLLAAGQGKRLWPLTTTRPKPLVPVAGTPLVTRMLRQIAETGIQQVTVVVAEASDPVAEETARAGKHLGLEITMAEQRQRRGTGHALQQAELPDAPVLVAYGDLFLPAGAVQAMLDSTGSGGAIGAREVPDPTEYGALEVEGDRLVRIEEKSSDPPSSLVNAGLYVLPDGFAEHLDAIDESPRGELELTDAINAAAREGHRLGVHTFQAWVDVGWPWDLLAANELALSELEPRIEGEVHERATLEGPVVVEQGATVKPGAQVIGPVHIGQGAQVGPNCLVRPSTTLGANTKVGNGCEVKNSVLLPGAKVPHVSYCGDSVLGQDVNLGAGTQVANLRHDDRTIRVHTPRGLVDSDRRKLGVILGDGVKTGINATLNCGVMLGPGALVGPGEVVMASRLPDDGDPQGS